MMGACGEAADSGGKPTQGSGSVIAIKNVVEITDQIAATIEYRIGYWLEVSGDVDGAWKAYERSANLDPAAYSALSAMASMAYERGDDEEAVQLLTKAISADPELVNAWHFDDVELEIEKLSLRLSQKPHDLYALLRRGSLLHGLDRLESAEEDLRLASQIDPRSIVALQLRASIALGSEPRLSRAICDELIRTDPSRPRSYMQRSYAHFNIGNYEAARQDIEHAIRLQPIPLAIRRRGLCRFLAGDSEGAIADYMLFLYERPEASVSPIGEEAQVLAMCTERIESDADDHFALFLRGAIREQQNRYDAAIQDLSAAVTLSPDSALYHIVLARAHFNSRATAPLQGEYLLLSLRSSKRAVDLAPRHPAAVGDLAHGLLRTGDYGESAEAAMHATQTQPDYAGAWLTLAIASARNNNQRLAARSWSIAGLLDADLLYFITDEHGRYDRLSASLMENPAAVVRRFERANMFAMNNYSERALREYATCLADHSDFVLAHHNIGAILCQNGRHEEGIASLRRALQHAESLR